MAARREEIQLQKLRAIRHWALARSFSLRRGSYCRAALAVESAKGVPYTEPSYPEYIQVTREWPPQFKWIGPESTPLDTEELRN